MRHAKVLYLTKVWADEWQDWLSDSKLKDLPQIVYDTGGFTNRKAEIAVAKRGGVVVASALAALRHKRKGPWNTDAEFRSYWKEKEPADDTARLKQIVEVIKYLKRVRRPYVPSILNRSMRKAKAYAITLGELDSSPINLRICLSEMLMQRAGR